MTFSYHEGQRDYLARMATLDSGLVAADTGTGKSLMALSIAQLKLGHGQNWKGRCLIVAPQNTTRSKRGNTENAISQWHAECRKFAPGISVFEIHEREDIGKVMAQHGGTLPDGIYLSYYEAMFSNGSLETIPASWSHEDLCKRYKAPCGPTKWMIKVRLEDRIKSHWYDVPDQFKREKRTPTVGRKVYLADKGFGTIMETKQVPEVDYIEGIGESREGFRCILTPCLTTELDAWYGISENRSCAWDMVCADEIHCITNMESNITRQFIRLQPRFRWAFTATPISNIVSDIFPIMGWVNVPDWFRGKRSNPRWPYTLEQLPNFETTFLTEERDHTQEEKNREASKGKWSGKCTKKSPVIAAPASLLKIVTNSMGFITKKACNPNYQEPSVHDIRVPMSTEQAELYRYWMDPRHIPCKNAWQRAGIQISRLRECAAAPYNAYDKFGGSKCLSNMTPKIITGLELIAECLERGEQAVCISSRIAITDTIQRYLTEALGEGLLSRIDSTTGAKEAQVQSNAFKQKRTLVNLMGIKCAAGHSYHECPNEIIFSIEYSYGPFHQAKGRIDRVNSRKPGRVYCLLHEGSIEETMWERCATKEDAARICLHGQRLPRDYKPLDMGEILATHLQAKEGRKTIDTTDCIRAWPALKQRLQNAFKTYQSMNIIPIPVTRQNQTVKKTALSEQPVTAAKVVPFPKPQPKLPKWLTNRMRQSN